MENIISSALASALLTETNNPAKVRILCKKLDVLGGNNPKCTIAYGAPASAFGALYKKDVTLTFAVPPELSEGGALPDEVQDRVNHVASLMREGAEMTAGEQWGRGEVVVCFVDLRVRIGNGHCHVMFTVLGMPGPSEGLDVTTVPRVFAENEWKPERSMEEMLKYELETLLTELNATSTMEVLRHKFGEDVPESKLCVLSPPRQIAVQYYWYDNWRVRFDGADVYTRTLSPNPDKQKHDEWPLWSIHQDRRERLSGARHRQRPAESSSGNTSNSTSRNIYNHVGVQPGRRRMC